MIAEITSTIISLYLWSFIGLDEFSGADAEEAVTCDACFSRHISEKTSIYAEPVLSSEVCFLKQTTNFGAG